MKRLLNYFFKKCRSNLGTIRNAFLQSLYLTLTPGCHLYEKERVFVKFKRDPSFVRMTTVDREGKQRYCIYREFADDQSFHLIP